MAEKLEAVYKVEIEDEPGALMEILSATAGSGVNIMYLAAFSKGGGKGEAYLVPNRSAVFEQLAENRGMDLSAYAGLLFSGADRVGIGAEVTKPIADAGVNIVLSTALVVQGEYFVLIVVDKEDAEAAAAAVSS